MTPENLTALVAVLISAGALAISILAWRAAHRAAKATERSALADEQAAHQARAPKFTAEIEPASGGGWHRLAVRLDGPVDLDELTVEILGGELVYTSDHYGVPRSQQDSRRQAWPYDSDGNRIGLAIGEAAKWKVVAADKHVDSDEVTLRCHAKAGDGEWKVLVTVAVPRSLGSGPRVTFI